MVKSVTGFTPEKINELIGDVITGVRLVENKDLVFTTASGKEISAGDVRGFTLANATAATLPSNPVGNITDTFVQPALAKVATQLAALNTSKLPRNQIRKVFSGIVTHTGGKYAADSFIEHDYFAFDDVFPVAFFDTPPQVVVTPVKGSLITEIRMGWSVGTITTRGFTLAAASGRDREATYAALLPLKWQFIAASMETYD